MTIINKIKSIKSNIQFFLWLQICVLVFGVGAFIPKPADALLLLIIDHNSCWVNIIWGCDGGDGGGGGGGSVTYSYESDYPGATSGGGTGGGTGGVELSAGGQPITRMSAVRDSLKDPCTAGDTCPGDDLEELAAKISVNPAYADFANNKCPLFWTQGKDEAKSVVECKLVTNGTSQVLPKNSTNKNTFSVPVGKHVLSCTRTTTEVVTKYSTDGAGAKTVAETQTNTWTNTEEYNVRCLARPNVIEQ